MEGGREVYLRGWKGGGGGANEVIDNVASATATRATNMVLRRGEKERERKKRKKRERFPNNRTLKTPSHLRTVIMGVRLSLRRSHSQNAAFLIVQIKNNIFLFYNSIQFFFNIKFTSCKMIFHQVMRTTRDKPIWK